MVLCCPCVQHNGYQQINSTQGKLDEIKNLSSNLNLIHQLSLFVLLGVQGPRFGVRHIQCILAFCGLAVAYALRVNLSVAIVAMTDKNATNPDFEVGIVRF